MLNQDGFALLASKEFNSQTRLTALRILAKYNLNRYVAINQYKVLRKDQPRVSRTLATMVRLKLLIKGPLTSHGYMYRLNADFRIPFRMIPLRDQLAAERETVMPAET